ncbi:hypothetical protein ACHAXS_000717, partial [Conticribra weissflogii]
MNRFIQIIASVDYTNKPPPSFVDKFHNVHQMLDAFNKHYEDNYIPSWINCLNESMSFWLKQYCPGLCLSCKSPIHAVTNTTLLQMPIMWQVKLQEGKDCSKDANNKPCFLTEFESHTKTSALMLYMTKPINNTGKVVTMVSGFCVAAGILELHDVGVHGQSLIKKCGRFWPKHVPGQLIDDHMKDKEMGFAETYKQSIG